MISSEPTVKGLRAKVRTVANALDRIPQGETLIKQIKADLLARTVATPAELPIGIVTALMGGPFFLRQTTLSLAGRAHCQP